MARFGADKLDAMIRKFGVPVSHTQSGVLYESWGIVDESDDEQVQTAYGALSSRIFEVLIKTGELPQINETEVVTVDGSDYTVVRVQRIDDGLVTRLLCTLD